MTTQLLVFDHIGMKFYNAYDFTNYLSKLLCEFCYNLGVNEIHDIYNLVAGLAGNIAPKFVTKIFPPKNVPLTGSMTFCK